MDGTISGGSGLSTPVSADNGGTGQSSYNAGDILYASDSTTLSKLAAGSDGEVLKLASGIPSWAAESGGTIPDKVYYYKASDFDALETNFAPLNQDNGSTSRILSRAFNDTIEEFVNFSFKAPSDIDTSGTVTFRVWMYAATAVASRFVQLAFDHRAVDNSESWDGSYTSVDSGDLAIDGTQDDITEATWTETVSNLGWSADDFVMARLSRIAPSGTNLNGDLYVVGFSVEIPRA